MDESTDHSSPEFIVPRFRTALASHLALGGLLLGGYAVATQGSAPAAEPEQALSLAGSSSFTVTGGGYGHGNGMSQYGAAGAAHQGLGHRKILAFYYPGTTIATRHRPISVLVSADTTDDVVVKARTGLTVRVVKKRSWTLPTKAKKRAVRKWRLTGASGGRTHVAYRTSGGWTRWKTLSGTVEFIAKGARPITLVLPGGSTASYRGALRSGMPRANSTARDTVNVLSRENYLRGVVPAEMPASWPSAAVRSQAVAARTYAAHEQAHPLARHYQVCDTTACQVYRGTAGEHPLGDAAVKATSGQVLLFKGSMAFTQFSSSNGGWSSTGSKPYLVAKKDPYDGWSGNPVHRWTVPVSKATLRKVWPALGAPEELQVLARDGRGAWGGRVQKIRITGSQGSVTVSGSDFRFLLGLRSDYFTVASGPKRSARN